jgi:hypothetical protein
MKLLALATLAAVGISTLTACDPPEPSALENRVAAQRGFERADANNDGAVTQNEALAVPNLSFASADINKDSALSPEEFEVAFVNSRPRG